ncbi:MAG TPA: HAD-IA family hydrolase [Actinomycetes bacterium]|nr:HAD-IA family hydrolase [Actinomycetes bacterium]
MAHVTLDPARLDAVVFDMDGVITDTAAVHLAAWARLFDEVLPGLSQPGETPALPFTAEDYRRYVDGVRREDGVARFLASRDIAVAWGSDTDGPEAVTVVGLGRRKNDYFLAELGRSGARAFGSSVALVQSLQARGLGVALVSASRNARVVLDAAGVGTLFAVVVDGTLAARLGLAGKPEPDLFVEAARRAGSRPDRAAVVEDALAGVAAGRAGGFALVVGVDRSGAREALLAAGADMVVEDLAEVDVLEPDVAP